MECSTRRASANGTLVVAALRGRLLGYEPARSPSNWCSCQPPPLASRSCSALPAGPGLPKRVCGSSDYTAFESRWAGPLGRDYRRWHYSERAEYLLLTCDRIRPLGLRSHARVSVPPSLTLLRTPTNAEDFSPGHCVGEPCLNAWPYPSQHRLVFSLCQS